MELFNISMNPGGVEPWPRIQHHTVVEERGHLRSFCSVLTMCYCFVYTIHYKFVCNKMQVYKHVSVNLVIPIHTYVQLAQCALRYIT